MKFGVSHSKLNKTEHKNDKKRVCVCVCVTECRDEKVEIKDDELAGRRFTFIFRDATPTEKY